MLHKRFDFSQLGGFPLNQQRLEFMQKAYGDLSTVIASLAGDNTIVSGCEQTDNGYTDGWVVVGGELLPFVGGNSQMFSVQEMSQPLVFADANAKNVQISRYAMSNSEGAYNLQTFIRMDELRKISNENRKEAFGFDQKNTSTPYYLSYHRKGNYARIEGCFNVYSEDVNTQQGFDVLINVPFRFFFTQSYFVATALFWSNQGNFITYPCNIYISDYNVLNFALPQNTVLNNIPLEMYYCNVIVSNTFPVGD